MEPSIYAIKATHETCISDTYPLPREKHRACLPAAPAGRTRRPVGGGPTASAPRRGGSRAAARGGRRGAAAAAYDVAAAPPPPHRPPATAGELWKDSWSRGATCSSTNSKGPRPCSAPAATRSRSTGTRVLAARRACAAAARPTPRATPGAVFARPSRAGFGRPCCARASS